MRDIDSGDQIEFFLFDYLFHARIGLFRTGYSRMGSSDAYFEGGFLNFLNESLALPLGVIGAAHPVA